MSIFDDLGLEVAGTEVTPEEIAEGVETTGHISWPVVVRWCKEHPGYGRAFTGLYRGVTTNLRKRFPELIVRSSNHREEEGGKLVCDLIVAYVPPGMESPFEPIPGRPVDRVPPPLLRKRDQTGKYVKEDDLAPWP